MEDLQLQRAGAVELALRFYNFDEEDESETGGQMVRI